MKRESIKRFATRERAESWLEVQPRPWEWIILERPFGHPEKPFVIIRSQAPLLVTR